MPGTGGCTVLSGTGKTVRASEVVDALGTGSAPDAPARVAPEALLRVELDDVQAAPKTATAMIAHSATTVRGTRNVNPPTIPPNHLQPAIRQIEMG